MLEERTYEMCWAPKAQQVYINTSNLLNFSFVHWYICGVDQQNKGLLS